MSRAARKAANVLRKQGVVTSHVRSGLPRTHEQLRIIAVDRRDIGPIRTVMGQLKGRSLSTAAVRFVHLLSQRL